MTRHWKLAFGLFAVVFAAISVVVIRIGINDVVMYRAFAAAHGTSLIALAMLSFILVSIAVGVATFAIMTLIAFHVFRSRATGAPLPPWLTDPRQGGER